MLLTTLAGGGFCSRLPSVHFLSVGADMSLHYVISCNSKPLSIRAARFKWGAQPEQRVGLTLCRSALLPPSTVWGTRRVLQRASLLLRLAEPQELCLLGSHKCDLFFCVTLLSGYCNRSGRCSYFKKVWSVEQTSRDRGLKWYCLVYFLIDFFYKYCLMLLPVVTGGQAVLAGVKDYIYSPSTASKGSREVVSTF